MNAIEAARQYLQQGWQVIPVSMPCGKQCDAARRGERCSCGKRPLDNNWPNLKVSAETVGVHFRPDSNVGVVLGDGSRGLVDIDLDCPEAVALAPRFLPPTTSFGRKSSRASHRLYYCPGMRTEKFQQPMGTVEGKARFQMLVELRANKASENGEGLQTVFPGSTHSSGEKIEWETRDGLRAIEKIKPEQLRTCVARLASATLLLRLGWSEERVLAFGRSPSEGALSELTRPNHALIARWLGFAPPPAQQQERRDEQKLKRATAYLKAIAGAVSGSGGHQQTWGAALAVVRGFDLSENEAYSLLSSEYNNRCDPPWSERELRHKISDAANNSHLPRGYILNQDRAPAPRQSNGVTHQGNVALPMESIVPLAAPEWEQPIEFDAFDLPPFPVAALPPVLAEFVRACSTATQTPPDLAGMLSLAACAAAVAKRLVVEVKPGYQEPVNLFAAVILPPADRKSAVMREVTRPIQEWEARAIEKAAPDIAKAAQRWTISKKRLDAASDRAAKAKTKEERETLGYEVEDLAEQHSKIIVPPEPRLLADDATPEALASLLANLGGRIAIFSAEGGVFQQMAGKYSESPSLDVYLKAHAGDEIRVDRKGRPSERVPDPALTLGLAIQPAILDALSEKPLLRGTGLLARFLYALPTSMLGARSQEAPPIPAETRAAYSSMMSRLLDLQEQKQPVVVKLSKEAYLEWCHFSAWLEPQLGEFGELASIRDWAGKLSGATARISAILGILGILALNSHSKLISISIYIDRDAMVHAIHLARYLIPHAQAVFSSMGADPDIAGAKYLLKCIQKKGWTAFSRREVQQAVKGSERFNVAEQLDRSLKVLVERNYLRLASMPSAEERGRGRPAGPGYEVNPGPGMRNRRQNSHNPQNSGVSVSNETNNGDSQVMDREPGEDDE